MSALRIGIVGVGHMGRLHAQKVAALAAQGDVVLDCVTDLDLARAEEVARAVGTQVAKDLAALVSRVDAVIVAVPTVDHFAVVWEAVRAGLDVLVEKPIAASIAQGEALLALGRERGSVIQVGHLEWFNAAMRRVANEITRPRFIEAHRMGPFPDRATDVDVVRDLMIHDLDIILRLVGEEPQRVEAIGVPVITEQVDIANARLTFPGGCVANVTASRVTPTPMRKIRFFQADGYFSIDFLAQDVTLAQRGAPDAEGRRPVSLQRLEIDREDALLGQLRSFQRACTQRHVEAGALNDGLTALRLALRIMDAMPSLEALQ